MIWAWRIFRFWFIGPNFESPWTVWTFMLTLFVAGASLRAAIPESLALPVLGGMAAASFVGWLVYRAERPGPGAPLHSIDAGCIVEILSDPPPPRR